MPDGHIDIWINKDHLKCHTILMTFVIQVDKFNMETMTQYMVILKSIHSIFLIA